MPNEPPPDPASTKQQEQSPTRKLQDLGLTLHQDEELIEVIHKHWGSILWPLTGLGVLIFLTLVGLFLVTVFEGLGAATSLLSVVLVAFYIFTGLYVVSEWYAYKHSALVVTNQRIIDCDQVNVLSRQLQIIDLHEIQSCSGHFVPGWGTIFSYGVIWVNTIGDKSIAIRNIKTPEVTAELIMQQHNIVAHTTPKPPDESDAASQPSETEYSGLPPAFPDSPPSSQEGTPKVMIMFQVNESELSHILADICLDRAPLINPINDGGQREVEIIVNPTIADDAYGKLSQRGAQNILRSDIALAE